MTHDEIARKTQAILDILKLFPGPELFDSFMKICALWPQWVWHVRWLHAYGCLWMHRN